jgi:hypothetical protein
MSNTPEIIENNASLAQNIKCQGDSVAFQCSICGKKYKNLYKGQFHETICEHKHSTDPEKLCRYCDNPCKTKYPTYVCSRHGEYPDTDEEFPEREWDESGKELRDSCHSPSWNADEMYLDYLSSQADKEEDERFNQLVWEARQEEYAATHCWYCDKVCESEEEKMCHESYCKTRDHGNYSDDEW